MLSRLKNKEFIDLWLPALISIVLIVTGVVLEEEKLFIVPFVILGGLFLIQTEIKQLFFLLLFLIPLSTEYSVTGSLSLDFPDEPFMLLITGGLLAYFLLKPALFPAEAKYSSLFVLLLMQIAWMLVTVLFSTGVVLSTKYLLAKVWYIVPFVFGGLMFMDSKEDFLKAAKLLILAMTIPIVISLVLHSFRGFSFESVNDTLRPFFRNHVSYSGLMVCLIPVLYIGYRNTTGKQKVLLKYLVILFMAALFFSYSRGAWLCVIGGAITWWAMEKKILMKLILVSVIAVVMAVAWLIADENYMKFAPDFDTTEFHTDFSQHMQATYQLKDVSTMERFYRWIAGVRMVKEEPVTGFGPNTFYKNYKSYTVAAFKTWVSDNEEHSTVHNYFLLLAIEQGLPGMILFIILVYFMFLTGVTAYNQLPDLFDRNLALISTIVLSMIIILNLLSDLIETDKIGSIYFLILGIMIKLQMRLHHQKASKSVSVQ
ncbi:MAG: O-antigen ligase family protein [Chitinophagaceae bacterium]